MNIGDTVYAVAEPNWLNNLESGNLLEGEVEKIRQISDKNADGLSVRREIVVRVGLGKVTFKEERLYKSRKSAIPAAKAIMEEAIQAVESRLKDYRACLTELERDL